MLKSILVKNFILFDSLELEFSKGFNIFTGETGAGKSMIINAIDVALGAKSSREMIKNNSDKAYIELVFDVESSIDSSFLADAGIDLEESEIIVTKEITQGAVRQRVNGAIVSQDVIKELRQKLVDIHSQHDTFVYLQPKYHLELLDAYGSSQHRQSVLNFKDLYLKWRALSKELAEITDRLTSDQAGMDFLKFKIKEIEEADINDINEDLTLEAERKVIANSEDLKKQTSYIYELLAAEEVSARGLCGKAFKELSGAVGIDSSLEDSLNILSSVMESLDEVSRNIRNYSENISTDLYRLDFIEKRLDTLDSLKRKYGGSLKSVAANLEKAVKELNEADKVSEKSDCLRKELSETEEVMSKKADEISENRYKISEKLSAVLTEELYKLELPKARFAAQISKQDYSSSGKDRAEFLITTNVSQELKPLAKAASGGELSRIMLALKSVFANQDKISTVIFDEIDTGISGKASQAVAQEMYKLANTHQIISVTHLPVIAAKADAYFSISKYQNEQTEVRVRKLSGKEKMESLAVMAAGSVTEDSLNFAKRLLKDRT